MKGTRRAPILSLLCLFSLAPFPERGALAQPARPRPELYPDQEYDAELGKVHDLAYSPDGRLLALVGPRGLGVWDAQTGHPIRRHDGLAKGLRRVAFGGHANLLTAATDDGRIYLIDLRTGAFREAARRARPVTALAFSPDGRLAASGDADGGIVLWDADRGEVIADLKREGHTKGVMLIGFLASGDLLSLGEDLQVITWDVGGKRSLRRSTLRLQTPGRSIEPEAAHLEAGGLTLAVSSQHLVAPRGGHLTTGMAHPEDLKRVNVILPYAVATGMSSDPIPCGDFLPRRLALSPGGCFAFFTSAYRDRPRLHVWGLVEKGDDLFRSDLQESPTALALDPGGRALAIGFESGKVRTWRISGAGPADCEAQRRRASPSPTESRIALGPEGEPLIAAGSGYRIAVLRFEVGGVEPHVGEAVSEMVAGELSNSRDVVVVERSAIDAILRELEIQRSGLTTADAVKIGRGLNARKVCLGSVRRFGESTFVILARVVDVETQQVEGTRQVTCENCGEKDLPRAVEALRRAVLR